MGKGLLLTLVFSIGVDVNFLLLNLKLSLGVLRTMCERRRYGKNCCQGICSPRAVPSVRLLLL